VICFAKNHTPLIPPHILPEIIIVLIIQGAYFLSSRFWDFSVILTLPINQNNLGNVMNLTTDKWNSIREKSEPAIQAIYQLIEENYTLAAGVSFGKDSLCVLVLAIEAMKRAIDNGLNPSTMYVTHSDTTVENPALGFYCKVMIECLEQYAIANNLPIKVVLAKPALTSTFAYTVIGRGRTPVFPNKKTRICSVDWKLRPQQRALKKILKASGCSNQVVSLVGTRYSESTNRGHKMAERGDSATNINIDVDGNRYIAPIADWDLEDVWELLMSVDSSRGQPFISTFRANFDWTLKLYKDANEGACAIIVGDKGNKAACGSRFGCWTCTAVANDKSLNSMVASESGEYAHLKGLTRFRQYLVDTQFDLSLRTCFGHKVSPAGYLNYRPDNYNHYMRTRLLRYMITLDVEEEERAEQHYEAWLNGEIEHSEVNEMLCEPQFKHITPDVLLAIEFAWGLGHVSSSAFPALSIWYEIKHLGKRYHPPVLKEDEIKKDKIPAKQWIYIGDIQAEDGLRNRFLEGRRGSDGYIELDDEQAVRVSRMEFDSELTIDREAAAIFMNLEFEDMYFQFANVDSAHGLFFLLDRGLIKMPKSKVRMYHDMAKRYQKLHKCALPSARYSEDYEKYKIISNAEHSRLLESLSPVVTENVESNYVTPDTQVSDLELEDYFQGIDVRGIEKHEDQLSLFV